MLPFLVPDNCAILASTFRFQDQETLMHPARLTIDSQHENTIPGGGGFAKKESILDS